MHSLQPTLDDDDDDDDDDGDDDNDDGDDDGNDDDDDRDDGDVEEDDEKKPFYAQIKSGEEHWSSAHWVRWRWPNNGQ